MDNSLSIADLASLRSIAIDFGISGDDYLVACFRPADLGGEMFSSPVSIAGLALVLIKRGRATVNIDFNDVVMEPNSIMSSNSKTGFAFRSGTEAETEVQMVCFSHKFLHDLNFDMHSLNLHEFVDARPNAVTQLTEAEARMIELLIQALLTNARHNAEPTFSMQIGRSLAQALIYQQLHIFSMRRSRSIIKNDSPTGSRQLAYVQEFVHQLQLHHTHHRSISFYADKLCISQKYLSHVIKEATGRSASDWIAEYVVMEAKNLLRFSHKNVQQVAYSLNFPTQSSFGKYFKHVTGISPSEFQKG